MKGFKVLLGLVLALGVLAVVAPLASADAPPGATALCSDGTYSFSKTHSGTCSHHGGVAEWLDVTGTTTTTPSTATTTTPLVATVPSAPGAINPTTTTGTPAGSSSTGSRSTAVAVGNTVPLAHRTKTSGCALGPNPDRRCSPGAIYTGLTKAVICSPTFHTSTVRNVLDSERFAVEQEYGLTPRHYGNTLEIDHIVSLELGGSNDIANLFPEKASPQPGYRVKDKLENRLHALVCSGTMTLRVVQHAIATDWQGLYKQVYGTSPV